MEVSKGPERKTKERPESIFRSLGRLAIRIIDSFVDLFVPESSKKK